jgi:hypothetical protein
VGRFPPSAHLLSARFSPLGRSSSSPHARCTRREREAAPLFFLSPSSLSLCFLYLSPLAALCAVTMIQFPPPPLKSRRHHPNLHRLRSFPCALARGRPPGRRCVKPWHRLCPLCHPVPPSCARASKSRRQRPPSPSLFLPNWQRQAPLSTALLHPFPLSSPCPLVL